ncbi:hypothetical protein AALO_G00227170 [Alosa alosa]|uniref:PARP catalytic domain-containing protein n=1 Tax=Alosa alosa TaxID=278164 RepID=A0AAV6G321_9TELE|nr:nuclear pore complex protein DDB_G0274915-like [Alosa alosa]XP_048124489.1 nuclear pore complex protein DDB_G0274915-like [Alosa alosa]KAG5267897.1 hypothetical protein AALO_G00227170 [Alosa alosa]
MVHKNLRYGTQRPVRRRPKFVSSDDVQTARTRKRERMKVNNKKYGERKFLLFHGTESDSKLIDSICYQNFDCKCGGKGAEYGEGCYFARDALYSHLDTSDHGMHSMFVCRALVGSYTKGQSYRLSTTIFDFPDSSTAFKSMESAPQMVTVATLTLNSSVSPSSVVPSTAGRLPSDSLTTTGQSGTSSGTVLPQLSSSDTSAPTVGASSPSSVQTTPTKPSTGSLQSSATKLIPYPRASKSSNLDPTRVLPSTRSQAVSVKPCPPPKPVGVSHFVIPIKEILGTTCTHSAVSEEINPPVSGPAPHNNSRVPSPMPRQVASSSVASDTTAQSSASQGGSDDTTDPSSPERQTPRVSDLINRFNHGKL